MGLRSVRNNPKLSSELLSNKGQVKRSLDVIATVSNVYRKFFQKVDSKAAREPQKLIMKNKENSSGNESDIDEAICEEYGLEGVTSIVRNIINK